MHNPYLVLNILVEILFQHQLCIEYILKFILLFARAIGLCIYLLTMMTTSGISSLLKTMVCIKLQTTLAYGTLCICTLLLHLSYETSLH